MEIGDLWFLVQRNQNQGRAQDFHPGWREGGLGVIYKFASLLLVRNKRSMVLGTGKPEPGACTGFSSRVEGGGVGSNLIIGVIIIR